MSARKPPQAFRGLEYIRRYYGVPAKRGGRISYVNMRGIEVFGTITSAPGPAPHLRVRLDGERVPVPFHPTEVTYLTQETR